MPPEDPCAVLAELLAARRKIITGAKESRVSFRSGDVERDVRYDPANLTALDAEIRKYTDLCEVASGRKAAPRFAIRAG